MDMIFQMSRMPIAGETVLGNNLSFNCGGKGANQAYAAGKLGGQVMMLGYVGNDNQGRDLVKSLSNVGVDVGMIGYDESLPTGVASIYLDNKGENSIVVVPSANSSCNESYLRSNDHAFFECDYILLQMEIPIEAVAYAVKRGYELGKTVILNPAPAPDKLPKGILKGIDFLIPNESELAKLSGYEINNKNDIHTASSKMVKAGVKELLVTLGKSGSLLMNDMTSQLFPSISVKSIDTTAAGDCFCAAFTVALSEGKTIEQAIRFANIAAGLTVTKKGAQRSIPSRMQVDRIYIKKALNKSYSTGEFPR